MKQTGYTNRFSPYAQSMKFMAELREQLNPGVSVWNLQSPDGAIMKSGPGLNRTVIYDPTLRAAQPLVCFYVGPDNSPLSEYVTATSASTFAPEKAAAEAMTPARTLLDLVTNRTYAYWGVSPEKNLNLGGKILLVIPCPVRDLTDKELESIKKFLLKPAARLFIFPGTEMTFVNAILKQLESCFELILIAGVDKSVTVRMGGLLPNATLISLAVSLSAWVGVNESETVVPIVRDINGFGVWYENICSLIYLYYYTSPDTDTNWVFGPEAISRIESEITTVQWTLDPDFVAPFYPYTYTDKTEEEYLAWYNHYLDSSIAPMTKAIDPAYQFKRNAAGWKDFSDLGICTHVGSLLAFSPSEKIITAGFIPRWLTNRYARNNQTAGTLSSWMFRKLEYADNFKQKYFMMPWPAMPKISRWSWPTPPIQS